MGIIQFGYSKDKLQENQIQEKIWDTLASFVGSITTSQLENFIQDNSDYLSNWFFEASFIGKEMAKWNFLIWEAFKESTLFFNHWSSDPGSW